MQNYEVRVQAQEEDEFVDGKWAHQKFLHNVQHIWFKYVSAGIAERLSGCPGIEKYGSRTNHCQPSLNAAALCQYWAFCGLASRYTSATSASELTDGKDISAHHP